eukprot:COSAG02_NODE_4689_length_5091_cov_1.795072_6_plen_86_part_00
MASEWRARRISKSHTGGALVKHGCLTTISSATAATGASSRQRTLGARHDTTHQIDAGAPTRVSHTGPSDAFLAVWLCAGAVGLAQ